jgi:hypothetical protein
VPCCLALALSQAPNFSDVPGPAGADSTEAPGVVAADPRCQEIDRSSAEKRRLAGEVIAGQLSLLEAAARFRDLDERPPAACRRGLRAAFPGASDDECHCRAVLSYVREELWHRPGADPAAADRLEAELRALLERGDPRLPGPDDVPDR